MKSFSDAKKQIMETDPRKEGETSKAFKQRVLHATVLIAAAIVRAFSPEVSSTKQIAEYEEAVTEWEEEWKRKSEDPEYIPYLHGKFISDFEAQFMSAITGNIDEFFACRVPECLYVGRNTDWAHNVASGSGGFWCPLCATKYRPFKEASQNGGRAKFNKVFIVHARDGALVPVAGEDKIEPLQEGKSIVYPIWWADTATQCLQTRFKEITAEMGQVLKGVAREDYLRTVVAKVQEHGEISGLFRPMQVSDYAKNAFAELERSYMAGTTRIAPPSYEHLKNGFFGMRATGLLDQPVLQQADLIRIWGYAKLTVRAAGSEYRAAKRAKTG